MSSLVDADTPKIKTRLNHNGYLVFKRGGKDIFLSYTKRDICWITKEGTCP